MKTLLLVPFVALAFASAAPAQDVPVRASVSTAGLALDTPAGVRALDLRILHAASALCGTPSPADQRGRAEFDRCRADVRATALAERDRVLASARSNAKVAVASGQ